MSYAEQEEARGFSDAGEAPLSGKPAVITGVSLGIGRATARMLAAAGARCPRERRRRHATRAHSRGRPGKLAQDGGREPRWRAPRHKDGPARETWPKASRRSSRKTGGPWRRG